MSDTPATAPAEEAQAKKSKLPIIIIAAVIVVALGGGGAFFFLKRGQAAESAEKDKKAAKDGKGKHKEDEEEEADAHAEDGEKGKEGADGKPKFSVKRLNLPDDKDVKNIIELAPFVVNLADKGEARYLRLVVSIGIGETKEEKPGPLVTTRVRNAMLAVLITKTSDEVLTDEGKATMRKQLLKAAQAAVEELPIEAVYITDFIVQL